MDNAWEWDPGGWIAHDLDTKLLHDQKHSTLAFTWALQAVKKAWFDQLGWHKEAPVPIRLGLNHIIQIVHMTNNNPFYL